MRAWAAGWLLGVALAAAPGFDPVGVPVPITLGQRSGFAGAYPCSVRVDPEGRTWVATDLGSLYVGDGTRFLPVVLPQALQGAGFGGMEIDHQGRLWLLSTQGLARLDRGVWHVVADIRLDEVVGVRRAEGISYEPTHGWMAVLTHHGAWLIPPGGSPQPVALPPGDTGEPALVWRGHELVANRGRQVWVQQRQAWSPLADLPLQENERLRGTLRADAMGHLYALTERNWYHLAPGGSHWDRLPYQPTPDGDRMARLEDGRIWILQQGRALTALEGRVVSMPLPPDLSLYGADARCLDPEGSLWISTTALIRIPAFGLVHVHAIGAGLRETWRIHRDPKDRLWVASEGGLFRYDASGWKGTTDIRAVHQVVRGKDGNMYFRSARKLWCADSETLRIQAVPTPDGDIRRGPVIGGDTIWVLGAKGGLQGARFTPEGLAWSQDPAAPRCPPGSTSYLWSDPVGRLWMSVGAKSFCRWPDGRWEGVAALDGHSLVDVQFKEPQRGVVAVYSPPSLLSIEHGPQGWRSQVIHGPDIFRGIGVLYAVAQDAQGGYWVNTDRGTLYLEPGPSPRIQRYGSDMGLPTEDTNQEALLLEEGKRVWVGTPQGLAEIRFAQGPRLPDLTPPTVLEARCGSWRQQGASNALTVRYGQGPVVWELGFPGAVRGEGARFQFREVGGTWADVAGTALQFPEISPGRHAYEVRVMPLLGQPGPSRQLELRVLPPWYRHPVAYLGWILLGAGCVLLVVRWRIASLKRRNRELTEAVTVATEGLRARERDLEGLTRRLYELNEAKNRVIGLAAHDLRNPLSGVLLHCDLLSEEDLPPDLQRQSVGEIRVLGDTMRQMIQRLLDVHAIEAGHAEAPQMAPMDLVRALSRAREHALPRASQKGMTLVMEPCEPARVMADYGQVAQILDNYLSNALKYAPPGSTTTLRIREGEGAWRIEVQDQGPGLTDEDLSRVFTEYARLSARPTAGETSVGLGLSLVKRLAEGMGGRVGVESTSGAGATFWVELRRV